MERVLVIAGDGDGHDEVVVPVVFVVADHDERASLILFMARGRIEIGPDDIAIVMPSYHASS